MHLCLSLVIAGWGRTTADNPGQVKLFHVFMYMIRLKKKCIADQTAVLQHVSVPFQSMEKCNELYGAALGNEVDDGRVS